MYERDKEKITSNVHSEVQFQSLVCEAEGVWPVRIGLGEKWSGD